MSERRVCPNCNSEITTPGAAFCGICGFALNVQPEGKPQQDTPHQPYDWMRKGNQTGTLPQNQQGVYPAQVPPTERPAGSQGGRFGQPYGQQIYGQQPYDQGQDYLMGTGIRRDTVDPITNLPFFNRKVWKGIGVFTLIMVVAQIMRFLLTRDSFPSIVEIIWSTFLYAVFITAIMAIQINQYRKKGVLPNLNISRFDLTSGLVLSSFFAIYIPHKFTADEELSTISESVNVWDQKSFQMVAVPRDAYVDEYVRPEAIKSRYFTTILLGYSLWFVQSSGIIPMFLTTNMTITAIGIYSFLHVAPGLPNYRKEIIGEKRFVGFLFLLLSAGMIVLGMTIQIPVP